jgi:hypothetical protein
MTYYARNNYLVPSSNTASGTAVAQFDEDDIDFNIGSHEVFSTVVKNNTVVIKSDRNNAFNADYQGNNNTTTTISGNNFTSASEPIIIEVQTAAGLSTYGQGFVTINNNVLTNADTRTPLEQDKLIELASGVRNPSSANPNPPSYCLTVLNPVYDSNLYAADLKNFDSPSSNG